MYILRLCETAPTSNTSIPSSVGVVIIFLQKRKIIDMDRFEDLVIKAMLFFQFYQRILCDISHFFVRNVSLVMNVLCVIS
jgi:hypothetical protein